MDDEVLQREADVLLRRQREEEVQKTEANKIYNRLSQYIKDQQRQQEPSILQEDEELLLMQSNNNVEMAGKSRLNVNGVENVIQRKTATMH